MRLRIVSKSTGRPAFALISVLALVSLAALTATAFLASARLEKTASMTTGDQTRLTLALDSGYHLGSYVYTQGDNTWNWVDFLMKEDGDGVGYLFHAVPYSGSNNGNIGQWYNYATFSCATLSNIGVTPLDPTNWSATTTWQGGFASNRLVSTSRLSRMMNFTDTNVTPNGPVTRIPLLFGRTSPVVSWITNYVTNPSTKLLSPTFRFAFFTEDPSGLIDAERMGGSTARNTGTNPNEFALGEIGLTNVSTFTNLRKFFLNPGMIEAVIRTNKVTNGSVTNPWRYLSSSFYSVNGWLSTSSSQRQGYQRIPAGLGYAEADSAINADQPAKRNLNEFFANGTASSSAMAEIGKAITNNLPKFAALRAGAMNTNAYISNIAANIVDYVDTDSTPTFDPEIALAATNPSTNTWRGVENIAWPNEVITRFTYTNRTIANGYWNFPLQLKQYVELWNLSSTEVQVNPGSYDISNNLLFYVKCGNYPGNYLTNFAAPRTDVFTNAPFKLPANSYGVMSTATRTINVLVPAALNPGVTNPFLTFFPSINASNKYVIRLNGTVIDATPGGRWTPAQTNLISGAFTWFATSVNFGTSPNGGNYNLAGGDPRGGLFIRQGAMDFMGNGSDMTPGGRNSHLPGSKGPLATVNPTNWPDGGHFNNSDILTPPFSGNSIPDGARLAGDPRHWIQKLNNSGTFSNICELGNIFDPIQWGDPTMGPYNGVDSAGWTNTLTQSATNFSGSCGRNTLHIGRPEHRRFAWTNVSGQVQPNMQASAASLLDIFCATTINPAYLSGRFDEGNQININTAPPKVLKALAAGVILTNDAAMRPSNNYSVPLNAIDAFVKGVTNFRAKYPFYSASQLTFIGTNTDWPNTNSWPAGAVFSTDTIKGLNGNFECNDAAAEEWFSKIYGLSKVYTRNYRIYVQAQLIKTRGANTNAESLMFGAIGRRYYDVLNQQNNTATNTNPSCSLYLLRKVDY